uniref:Uncharacterized protein n=1 Tax=Glossina austeni TaxID=7395 RepID=A0A1A9VGI0_GLOAU
MLVPGFEPSNLPPKVLVTVLPKFLNSLLALLAAVPVPRAKVGSFASAPVYPINNGCCCCILAVLPKFLKPKAGTALAAVLCPNNDGAAVFTANELLAYTLVLLSPMVIAKKLFCC